MLLNEVSALLGVIILDYITGILVSIYEKKINSTIGRNGIFKKFGIILCVMFSLYIDHFNDLLGTPIAPVIITFFIFNESFSILENLKKLNVPIPKFLSEIIDEKKNA